MPNNPLTQQELYDYGILRSLTPPAEVVGRLSPPYFPAGYFLVPPHDVNGPVLWRKFHAGYIQEGIIDPNRLGTGSTGAGNLYLADDGTWKVISAGGGGDMLQATYDVDGDGVVDSAERIEIIVRNSTGTTLTKGTVVYLSGATGNRPNAVRSQANTEATSSKTIGFVVANINNNSDGYVAVNGTLHDLDTSAFADGAALWLSPTVAGGWTTTVPQEPNHSVFLGYVARSHPTQGRIVILIKNGYELNELHDVFAPSPSNGDLLQWDTTNAYWKNWTPNFLTSVPTLNQVTTAGNTTTNSITVGASIIDTLTVGRGSGGVATNTVFGFQPLNSNTTGTYNLAIGYQTLFNNTTGRDNVALGSIALYSNISGRANMAIGDSALLSNTTGGFNVGVGVSSLGSNTIGFSNVAIGDAAVYGNTEGSLNIGIGANALFNSSTGNNNIGIGYYALRFTESSNNLAIGYKAGYNNFLGVNNIFIGYQTDGVSPTESNRTFIGNLSTTSTWLAGNLLLGTTTDSGYKLDVNGTARVSGITYITRNSNGPDSSLYITNTNTTGANNIRIGEDTNNDTLGFGWYASGGSIFNSLTPKTAYMYALSGASQLSFNTTTSTQPITFATNNWQEKMRIFGGGNVIIGGGNIPTDTGHKLRVQGTVSAVLTNATHTSQVYYNTTTGELTYGALPTPVIPTLAQVTTAGNTTTNGITVGASIIDTLTVGRGSGGVATNTAFGFQPLNSNTTGTYNLAIGYQTLFNNTTGRDNVALGSIALYSNISGRANMAIGDSALLSNTTGGFNVGVGVSSLGSNTIGFSNVAIGDAAVYGNTEGSLNIGIGANALFNSLTGNNNIGIGYYALRFTESSNNLAIGYEAGYNNFSGVNNIFIGYQTNGVSPTENNRTFIGNLSTTSTWLAGNLLLGTTTDNGVNRLQVNGSISATGGTSTEWNTAYANRITSLTTTGTNGASTLISNVLNIPNYTLVGLGGQPQLNGTGFVKASGTTITYDNSTYYLASNPSGYISSYAETDTLATVTTRGNTTANAITVGNLVVNTTNQLVDFRSNSTLKVVFSNINNPTPAFGTDGFAIHTGGYGTALLATKGIGFGIVPDNNLYTGAGASVFLENGNFGSATAPNGMGVGAGIPFGTKFYVQSNSNSVGGSSFFIAQFYGTSSTQRLGIQNDGVFIVNTDALYVHANKNVTVGGTVDSGLGKLQVNGIITATGGTSTNWNTAFGWGNHASAGYLTSQPWVVSGSNIYYNTGNVGIGVITPTSALHVNGSGRFGDSSEFISIGGGAIVMNRFYSYIVPDVANTKSLFFGDVNVGVQNWGFIGIRANTTEISGSLTTIITGGVERFRVNSTGNIGIGTTTPTKHLTINKTNATVEIRAASENENAFLYFGTPYANAGPAKAAIIAAGVNNWSRSNLHFCLEDTTNNSAGAEVNLTHSRMVITKEGSVGIGTVNPSSNLDVMGADAEVLVHYSNHSRGGLRALLNQRTALLTTDQNDDLVFGWENNPKGAFTERMRLDNGTGNFGIGTISPEVKLHVAGVVLSADSSGYGFYTSKRNNHITQNAYYNGTNWLSYGSSATFGSAVILQTAGDQGNALDISVDTSISAANEALVFTNLMRVKTNGNVLIGTTTDGPYKLDVNGATRVNSSLDVTSVVNIGGNTFISGGLGVKTGPGLTSDFDVNGFAKVRIDLQVDRRLYVNDFLYVGTSTFSGFKLDVNGSFRSATDSYFATISGNVGIGLTNPFSKLHVNGGIAVGHPSYPSLIYSNADTGEFRFDNRTSFQGYITFFPNGQNTVVGSEAMRILPNGNVLIGSTLNTGHRLDVNGTIAATQYRAAGQAGITISVPTGAGQTLNFTGGILTSVT